MFAWSSRTETSQETDVEPSHIFKAMGLHALSLQVNFVGEGNLSTTRLLVLEASGMGL